MNLIWHDSENNSTINQYDSGGTTSIPLRLTLLKKVLLAAGWTVVASSNGTTKVVGSDNSGTFSTLNSWVILCDPAGARCIGLQVGTSNLTYVTIKYVAAGGINTTTGSATTMCDANVPAENCTVLSNRYCTVIAGYVHAVADTAAPYGFYVVNAYSMQAYEAYNGFCLVYDPLTGCHASETDPYVITVYTERAGAITDAMANASTASTAFACGWQFRGTASAVFGGINMITWRCNTNGDENVRHLFPKGIPADTHRGQEATFMPVVWGGQKGVKGKSTMLSYTGCIYKTYGTTYTISSTRDRIHWGGIFVLPWVGQKVIM